MEFQKIMQLRRENKLDEALAQVEEARQSEPEDVWVKKAAGWVYYDFLAKYADVGSTDEFIDYLTKIKDLDLPDDDTMIFNTTAWQVGKIVFALAREEEDYAAEQIFDIIKGFHFQKPAEGYSFLLKAFHKSFKGKGRYVEFVDWWDLDHLMNQDFEGEVFNGKKRMALAEQVHIAYAKALLEMPGLDYTEAEHRESVKRFIQRLDQLSKDYPRYQYPPFYQAKLMVALGDPEESFPVFLPFARSKKNEFWIWDMMVDFFPDDPDMQLACYCKALSLNTDEKFLLKIRVAFAELLEEREMYSEAKTEIEQAIETRRANGFDNLPMDITLLQSNDWYKQAERKENNKDLYQQHLAKAEEVLFKDIEEEVVVVEFVNKNKNILNFVKNEEKSGFFKYPKSGQTPKIGDVLKVRFDGDGRENFYKILTMEKASAEEATTCEAIKSFDGNLSIIPNNSFGFVDDIYVHPKTIEKNRLTNGQSIQGKAILSYNQAKNEWGWKVSTVESKA